MAATGWLEHPREGLGVGWECEIYGGRAEESLVVRVQEFVVDDFEDQKGDGADADADAEGEGKGE